MVSDGWRCTSIRWCRQLCNEDIPFVSFMGLSRWSFLFSSPLLMVSTSPWAWECPERFLDCWDALVACSDGTHAPSPNPGLIHLLQSFTPLGYLHLTLQAWQQPQAGHLDVLGVQDDEANPTWFETGEVVFLVIIRIAYLSFFILEYPHQPFLISFFYQTFAKIAVSEGNV